MIEIDSSQSLVMLHRDWQSEHQAMTLYVWWHEHQAMILYVWWHEYQAMILYVWSHEHQAMILYVWWHEHQAMILHVWWHEHQAMILYVWWHTNIKPWYCMFDDTIIQGRQGCQVVVSSKTTHAQLMVQRIHPLAHILGPRHLRLDISIQPTTLYHINIKYIWVNRMETQHK